jgi:hypothetical protein
MIKKVKSGYRVLSSKGKNIGGPYKTSEEALMCARGKFPQAHGLCTDLEIIAPKHP